MNLNYLDKEDYKNITLLKMAENMHGNLPFFVRKYSAITTGLHRHEYMQINYIYQGKGKHMVNHCEFDIIKGDIFVIPPYIPHSINVSEDFSLEVFEFEFQPEFINQNFESIENIETFFDFAYIETFLLCENQVKPRLNLTGKVQVEVESLLNDVLNEYNAKKSGYMLLIKSLLLKLLVLVGREFTADMGSPDSRPIYDRHRDAILGAVKYIDAHYTEELNIDFVARKFALSQSYFSYLFRNVTSKTFTGYLTGLRISRAMELLKNTDRKVADICYEAGFNNIGHFNRIFKQYTDLTPLNFKKMH